MTDTIDTHGNKKETLNARFVYTVSHLNRDVRDTLEAGFHQVWVEGEVSNFSKPASGHWYFTLKDERAQIRCAMFRNRNSRVRDLPTQGQQVQVRGSISLYEARGDYQLIVDQLEAAGDGQLRQAFEALKNQLEKEGLFAAERKKPLPHFPRKVGIITSPTGAAIRDILQVLKRRWPSLPVLVFPVPVQGNEAAPAIVKALSIAAERADCDVLILARGGGSIEDLWSFNEETVARAIAACPIPIVSGIGHEIDFTIADFVSDQRAPTPSAAAEIITQDAEDLLRRVTQLQQRLISQIKQKTSRALEQLAWVEKQLQRNHPGRQLEQNQQRLDELTGTLQRSIKQHLNKLETGLIHYQTRLFAQSPMRRMQLLNQRLQFSQHGLQHTVAAQLNHQRQRLSGLIRALDTVSPLATLGRGYAIALKQPEGELLRTPAQVTPGNLITVKLSEGQLQCEVLSTDSS